MFDDERALVLAHPDSMVALRPLVVTDHHEVELTLNEHVPPGRTLVVDRAELNRAAQAWFPFRLEAPPQPDSHWLRPYDPRAFVVITGV